MKKAKDKIYGHLETVHLEIPEEIKNLPQDEKWLHAMCTAPIWKKDEYMAQSFAWADEWLDTILECPAEDSEPDYLNWCNPLARA